MQECLTKSRSYMCAEDHPISISVMSMSDLISLTAEQMSPLNKVSFYTICIFLQGGGKHTVDFETFDVKEKYILFLSQDQVNKFHLPVNYKGKLLVFTENFLCQNDVQTQFFGQCSLFSDLFKSPYFSLGDRFEEIIALVNFISEELNRPYNEMQISILNNYLFNILLITESLYQPQEQGISLVINSSKLLVSQFKSVVNGDLNKQYNLEYYAKKLNVGLRTLQNAFIEVEKQSPKQWLTDRMILEIKRNLAYNDFQISEIAYNLGFKEVTNFTKFFKSKTNLTPSMFRESLLE